MTTVDVVVPVYNEERALPENIPKLRDFLASDAFPYDWRIVIADNASTDGTQEAGKQLEKRFKGEVVYVRIEQKGRGRALKKTWGESPQDIVSYMDVDLSTGLDALPPLVRSIAEEGYHVGNGSRLLPGAKVSRSLKRRILTRGYLALIKTLFRVRFSDAQCGFKAMRSDLARKLIPHIENNNWFFDTEALILAEMAGYRIKDVPVSWVEDLDTRVDVPKTVTEDVKGLLRMWRERPWRRLRKGSG